MFSFKKKQKYLEISLNDYCSLLSDVIFKLFLEFLSPDNQLAFFYDSKDKRYTMGLRAVSSSFELLYFHFPKELNNYRQSVTEQTLTYFCENNFSNDSEMILSIINNMRPAWSNLLKPSYANAIRNDPHVTLSAQELLNISGLIIDAQPFSIYKMVDDPMYIEAANYISVLLSGLVGSFNELFNRTESITTSQSKVTFKIKL